AEDGIRADLVTGVQTCALPISALNWRRTLLIVVAAGLLLTLVIVRMMSHVHRRQSAPPSRAPALGEYAKGLRVLVRNGRLLVLRSEERRVGREAGGEGGGPRWA